MRFGTERPLEGRLIIVTGASSGVGYAAARRLTQVEGARVVAVARRRVFRIEALAKQVGEDRLIAVTADMAVRAQAEALAQGIERQYGPIDGFVHAVNRALRLTALDVSDNDFDLTMQVNVKSALYGVQAVAPILRKQGRGTVVVYNPTPVVTQNFVASEAVYSAAAQALSALVTGWTRQLDSAGVRVREVAPAPQVEEGLFPTRNSHDTLLVEALRQAVLNAPAGKAPAAPASRAVTAPLTPRVLQQRGGLVLTAF